MSDNADLAQVSGINTQLVVRVTWVIAGALACAAGTMLSLDVSLKPDLAFTFSPSNGHSVSFSKSTRSNMSRFRLKRSATLSGRLQTPYMPYTPPESSIEI